MPHDPAGDLVATEASRNGAHGTGRVPERELRLMVDGLRNWLAGLSHSLPQEPRVLGLLEGEPGLGQREILGALRHACRDLGIQTLWASGLVVDPAPPGAVTELALGCLSLASQHGGEKSPLSPEVEAELAAAAGRPAACEIPSLGPELDRSRRIDSVVRAVLELSARSPVIVLVERLGSADSFTRSAIGHLLRILTIRTRCGVPPRVLVVVDAPVDFETSELGDCVPGTAELCAFRVRARGVSREDLRLLVIQQLGEEGPLSFRERVMQATGGSLLQVQWHLWNVRERGGIKECTDTPLAADLNSLVKHRFLRLTAAQQRIVAAAAALSMPFDPALARTDLRCEEENADVLRSLVAAGWLEPVAAGVTAVLSKEGCTGEAHVVASPLLAEAILTCVDEGQRRELFSTLGAAVSGVAGDNAGWLLHAARLLARAKEWSAAVPVMLAASAALERLGCFGTALTAIEDLIAARPEQAPDDFLRRLLWRRAQLLVLSRNSLEAIGAYQELITRSESPEEQGRLWRLIGDLHHELGDEDSRFRAYGDGLRALAGAGSTVERLQLLAAVARAHLAARELDRSLGCLDECLEVIADQGLGADVDYLEVYRLAEELHYRRADYVEAAEFEQCLLSRSEGAGDARGQLKSLRHLAHLSALKDDWESADAYLARGLKVAKASASRWLYARALAALGLHERVRRNPQTALKTLRRATILFGELGKTRDAERLRGAMAGLELDLGLFDAAARSMTELAAALGPSAHSGGADLTGCREAAPQERRRWIRAMEKKSARGGSQLDAGEVIKLIQLLAVEGRVVDAQCVGQASLKRDWGRDHDTPVRVAFLLARLSVQSGDLDGALARLESALQGSAGKPRLDALAHAYLEVSSVLLARGDLSRAFEYLGKGCRGVFEAPRPCGVQAALECFSRFAIEVGQYAAAEMVAACLVELARQSSDPIGEAAGLRLLARAQAGRSGGEVPDATSRRWGDLVGMLEAPEERIHFQVEMGWTAFARREFDRALSLARECLELARRHGFLCAIDEILHLVGVVESAASNPKKNFLRALEVLEQALAGCDKRKRHRLRWEILNDVAAIYRERAKDDLADEYAGRAQEIELVVRGALSARLRDARWVPRRGHQPVAAEAAS